MNLVPARYFLTKGIGIHEQEFYSRKEALRDAGIELCNLVRVSGVIPPGCRRIARTEGIEALSPGVLTFAVQALSRTNVPGQIATAALGLALPADPQCHGYIAEAGGVTGIEAAELALDVEERAAGNLAASWGIEPTGADALLRGRKHYEFEGREVAVESLVSSAKGQEKRLWTTVLVAAVYLLD